MRPMIVLILILAGLAGAAAADEADHLGELGGLRALHAWTRATDAGEALVFVEVENAGDASVTLEGAEAEGLVAELVGFRLVNGEPDWQVVGPVPVAPGRTLHLEPDGLAIRVDGLTAPLVEGEGMDLDLLTSLGPLVVHVEVEAADAAAHGHAGHDH